MYDNDTEFVLHHQKFANQEKKLKGRFVQIITKSIMQYHTIRKVTERTKQNNY